MRYHHLADWLAWLERSHPAAIELGLDRVSAVGSRLQLDFSTTTVITVAGTNGKGSCVAALVHCLQAERITVGSYTSPHLLCYNERVRINGQMVSDTELVEAFAAVDAARAEISLTYFEFGTLAALWLFQRVQLQAIVLEVGLGGRLDAVNIVDPDIAIVTSIDLDHQDWLGDNRELIGREKAGIFRPGVPALCGRDMPGSVLQRAAELKAPLCQLGQDMQLTDEGTTWLWQGMASDGQPVSCQLPPVPLPADSVALALQAMYLLDLPPGADALAGLAECRLAGRLQVIVRDGVGYWLDVAHNPAAVRLLADRLAAAAVPGRTFVLFAVMADKDVDGMLQSLMPLIDGWWLPALADNPRAMPPEQLALKLAALGATSQIYPSVELALQAAAQQCLPGDRVLVCGSFFTVAPALAILSADPEPIPAQWGTA